MSRRRLLTAPPTANPGAPVTRYTVEPSTWLDDMFVVLDDEHPGYAGLYMLAGPMSLDMATAAAKVWNEMNETKQAVTPLPACRQCAGTGTEYLGSGRDYCGSCQRGAELRDEDERRGAGEMVEG